MPRIIPITDMRNTSEISTLCHESPDPIFITKNGYGDMVLMSIESYEKLIETTATDAAIAEAEAEMAESGITYNAREELPKLRKKYFG